MSTSLGHSATHEEIEDLFDGKAQHPSRIHSEVEKKINQIKDRRIVATELQNRLESLDIAGMDKKKDTKKKGSNSAKNTKEKFMYGKFDTKTIKLN